MNFNKAVDIILLHEGGYSKDPSDPGGETNFGISKRSYPDVDMKTITRQDAIVIYRRDYWDKCRIDELPESLRLITFDCAVNQGPKTAITILQSSIGVPVDGVIGSATIAALRACNAPDVLKSVSLRRFKLYYSNKNFAKYGFGWIARLIDVTVESKA